MNEPSRTARLEETVAELGRQVDRYRAALIATGMQLPLVNAIGAGLPPTTAFAYEDVDL